MSVRSSQDTVSFSNPAAAAQATATLAATGPTERWICTGIYATASGTAGQTAILNLRNSTTGAGTIIFQKQCVIPANGIWEVCIPEPNIPGAYGAAMTLEFSAGVASQTESVAITAYQSA